jgi:YVTN family beta-propeller protein
MWISNEADNTVDVIDSKTMKVTKKIPLSGHPNNLAITPDGRKLYVAIAQAPGRSTSSTPPSRRRPGRSRCTAACTTPT